MIADLGALPASDRMSTAQFLSLLDQLGPGLKVMTVAPSVDAELGHTLSRYVLVLSPRISNRSAEPRQLTCDLVTGCFMSVVCALLWDTTGPQAMMTLWACCTLRKVRKGPGSHISRLTVPTTCACRI